MKTIHNRHYLRQAAATRVNLARRRTGKIKYGIAAWLLGLPLPIILLAFVFRGCDF